MDLAGRAHQTPGRLVDEDALRGIPPAQRTGQGQSEVAFFVGSLFASRNRFTVDGGRTACVLLVKSITDLFTIPLSDSERINSQRGPVGSRRRHGRSRSRSRLFEAASRNFFLKTAILSVTCLLIMTHAPCAYDDWRRLKKKASLLLLPQL